jgi:flagellar biosynthesis protein FlhB
MSRIRTYAILFAGIGVLYAWVFFHASLDHLIDQLPWSPLKVAARCIVFLYVLLFVLVAVIDAVRDALEFIKSLKSNQPPSEQ